MASKLKIMMGLAIASLVAGDAYAQAPVRNGLRRTGEAAANVVQGTAQATGHVIRGTANVAGDVARGTANAAGNVARGTANVAGNVARGTAEATGDVLRGTAHATRDVVTAPFGGPAYDGRHAAGYRGVEANGQGYVQGQAGVQQQTTVNGKSYRLLHSNGREFICDNGHRVYISSNQTGQAAPTQANASQANWQQDSSQPANQGVQGTSYDQQSSAAVQGNVNQARTTGQANVQAQTYSQPPAPPSAPTSPVPTP